MKRLLLTFGSMAVVAAAAGLFQLKYTIEAKERELRSLEVEYISDQKTIRVLKAEWAFLNSPVYLQELSVKYLGLKPTAPAQVLSDLERLPWRRDLAKLILPKIDFVLRVPDQKPKDISFEPVSYSHEVQSKLLPIQMMGLDLENNLEGIEAIVMEGGPQ